MCKHGVSDKTGIEYKAQGKDQHPEDCHNPLSNDDNVQSIKHIPC